MAELDTASVNPSGAGRVLIAAEMDRQHADALASFATANPVATQIAASVRRTGRLALLGMGGSHWVNRTAAFSYRRLGIEVQSEVLSEVLLAPLPNYPRTVILTSQSGGSGEILAYLTTAARREERFGLTLNAESAMAQSVPSLIGAGGMEKAFAATRSILISQSLHMAVLAVLGADPAAALGQLRSPIRPTIAAALSALSGCSSYVLSGRSELQGVAESGALCLMELARVPAFAFEGGQLRHGPMEMLSHRTGVILLRLPGREADLMPNLAAACQAAGCPLVVFDTSGRPPIGSVLTIALPALDGMAACFAVLPVLQLLLVELAAQKVEQLGVPLRSSKVTTVL